MIYLIRGLASLGFVSVIAPDISIDKLVLAVIVLVFMLSLPSKN